MQAYNHILDGRRLLFKRNGKGSVKVLYEGVDHSLQILMSTRGEVIEEMGLHFAFVFFPLFFIAELIIKGNKASSGYFKMKFCPEKTLRLHRANHLDSLIHKCLL